MKSPHILCGLAALALLVTSCSKDEADASTGTDGDTTEVVVPTQDEADAAAAKEITEENLDEAMDALENELNADG